MMYTMNNTSVVSKIQLIATCSTFLLVTVLGGRTSSCDIDRLINARPPFHRAASAPERLHSLEDESVCVNISKATDCFNGWYDEYDLPTDRLKNEQTIDVPPCYDTEAKRMYWNRITRPCRTRAWYLNASGCFIYRTAGRKGRGTWVMCDANGNHTYACKTKSSALPTQGWKVTNISQVPASKRRGKNRPE